jgi:MoaA/NifB/PqqE/SkfB family radical SAM enzyme
MDLNTNPEVFPPIITGWKARWIRLKLFVSIIRQARKGNSLWKALKLARTIRQTRKDIHKLPGISRFVYSNGRYFWSENVPGWPSKQLDNFIKGELQRHQPEPVQKLQTLIFAITSRCTLRCRHCFEWDNLDASEHLNLEQLQIILEKFRQEGLAHIQFSGGEPLARFEDLLTLIGQAQSSMECWVLTSGFGLTAARAKALRQAGLTGINISLDHYKEYLHNEFRNNDKAFLWAQQAALNCYREGILVSLSLCATREFTTVENLNRYLDLARRWGAGFVRILEPRDTGRFKGEDVQLEPNQVTMLEQFFQDTNRKAEYASFPIVGFPGFHQRNAGCFGAGNRYLYVDSKGDIHACPFCQHAVANAVHHPLKESMEKLRQRGCHAFISV